MKNLIPILAFATTLFSCKKMDTNTVQSIDNVKDTIVSINDVKLFESQLVITNEIANKTLNNYFKSKGFLIQSEIDEDLNLPRLPKNKDKNVIQFIELKLFNNQLGVISYFNAPPGSVGHCVQPHNAIISNSDKGLVISNEEFLPTNFTIDSLKTIDNKNIIYSNDYDCFNNKCLKKYRIELN